MGIDQSTFNTMDITSSSQKILSRTRILRLTGWMVATTAESTAWTLSLWKRRRKMISSFAFSEETSSTTSGPLADFVTSRDATGPTYSQPLSMDGFGLAQTKRW